MTSSIKPEVYNLSQHRQRRTEHGRSKHAYKCAKISRVVLEICSRTDTLSYQNTPLPYRGGGRVTVRPLRRQPLYQKQLGPFRNSAETLQTHKCNVRVQPKRCQVYDGRLKTELEVGLSIVPSRSRRPSNYQQTRSVTE